MDDNLNLLTRLKQLGKSIRQTKVKLERLVEEDEQTKHKEHQMRLLDKYHSAYYAIKKTFEEELASDWQPVDCDGDRLGVWDRTHFDSDEEFNEYTESVAEDIHEFENERLQEFEWLEIEYDGEATFEGVKELCKHLDYAIAGRIHFDADTCRDIDILLFTDQSWFCEEDSTFGDEVQTSLIHETWPWEVDYVLETGKDCTFVNVGPSEDAFRCDDRCETEKAIDELPYSQMKDIAVQFVDEIRYGFKHKFEDGEERLRYEEEMMEQFDSIWEESPIDSSWFNGVRVPRNQKELEFIVELVDRKVSTAECGKLKIRPYASDKYEVIVFVDKSVYSENAGGGYWDMDGYSGVSNRDEMELLKRIHRTHEDIEVDDEYNEYNEDEE